MKTILIVARPEGSSGLLWSNKVYSDDACRALAADVNSAARAVRRAGYKVATFTPDSAFHILARGHVPYLDKDIEFLDVKTVRERIDEIAAVMLVGMTAPAGTMNAFLDATYNFVGWHDYYLNGVRSGEIGMYVTYFSNFDVPIILATGDAAACADAEREIPGVTTVTVKHAKNRSVAVPVTGAEELIEKAAAAALASPPPPMKKPTFPLKVRIVLTRTEYAADTCRWFPDTAVRIDARTVETTLDKLDYFTQLT